MSAYFRRERDKLGWNLEEDLGEEGLMQDLKESIDSDLRSAFNQQNRLVKSHYFSGFSSLSSYFKMEVLDWATSKLPSCSKIPSFKNIRKNIRVKWLKGYSSSISEKSKGTGKKKVSSHWRRGRKPNDVGVETKLQLAAHYLLMWSSRKTSTESLTGADMSQQKKLL